MNPPAPELLPKVLKQDTGENGEVVLDLHIPVDLEHFAGHFPGLPLLPGVVQIDWAMHFAREHLPLDGEFVSLENLKFQSVILPGASIRLTLAWNAAAGRLNFSYVGDDGRPHSSARLTFGNRTGAGT